MARLKSILFVCLLAVALLSPSDVKATTYTFTHPCAMYSQSDFDRVRSGLAMGTAPKAVQEAYLALKDSKYTKASYTAKPVEILVRGSVKNTGVESENYMSSAKDAAAAYQLALLWQLSGDDGYATQAVDILNAWATTCKKLTANDANQYLCAGAQGFTFAVAGEILSGYDGWKDDDKLAFKTWMVDIFAAKNKYFLDHHQDNACGNKHYWSNWDLVNLCSYMAIGILTDNSEMVDYVVDYFTNTSSKNYGNGNVYNLCLAEQTINGEQMMQNQESGRDQGHAEMSAVVAANLAQMAYTLGGINGNMVLNPALDFWSANDNALLKMEEYVALSNLRDGTDNANANGNFVQEAMPFTAVGPWCTGGKNHEAAYQHTCLSWSRLYYNNTTGVTEDTSRGNVRPGFELALNHYKNVCGLKDGYKYLEQLADKMRPECGPGDSRYGSNSGAFDQLGWGTLMMYTEPAETGIRQVENVEWKMENYPCYNLAGQRIGRSENGQLKIGNYKGIVIQNGKKIIKR